MPIEYISTNQSTTYEIQGNDDVFVLAGVSVTSISDAIEANFVGINNGMSLTIQGALYGATGIDLWQNSSENNDIWIYIGSEGHVHGTVDGIALRQGDDNVVINYGEISAQQAGVYFQGGEASVVNHGSISSFGNSSQGAVIFNSSADGTDVREVTNTGIISGAPQSTASSSYAAITNVSGAEFHLNNSGSIFAEGSNAVYSSASENFIVNSGLIDGDFYMLGLTDMFNSGTIAGDIQLGVSSDVYRASGAGVITGTLNLSSGNDTAIMGDAGGTVLAGAGEDTVRGGNGADNVFGEGDDDLLIGADGDDTMQGDLGLDTLRGGAGNDDLYGGEENDSISGGSGDDYIEGGDDDDILNGNSGDDVIFGDVGEDTINGGSGDDDIRGGTNTDNISGGAGDDTIRGESGSDIMSGGADDDLMSGSTGHDNLNGGSGDDRMFGGANNDTVEGTLGDDYLDGGSGNDLLRGGSDNDTLYGGIGQDTLSGGNGADVFVFNVAEDSPHDDNRDTITDFVLGVDMIDLSGFAGTLTFIGTAAYSGAAGEVRYNDAIGRLYINVDGGAASEASIDLTGTPSIDVGDLIL